MVNEHLQTEGLWHWVNIDPEKPCLVAWLIFQARKCYVNLSWIIIIEPLTMPLSHLILLVGLKRFSNPINPIIIPSKSGSIIRYSNQLPGKQPHNYGKSPFLMGEFTISMAIFQFAFCMFTRPGKNGTFYGTHWIPVVFQPAAVLHLLFSHVHFSRRLRGWPEDKLPIAMVVSCGWYFQQYIG